MNYELTQHEFNKLYGAGMSALKENNLVYAKQSLGRAALLLLELAKESGELARKEYMMKVKSINKVIDDIDRRIEAQKQGVKKEKATMQGGEEDSEITEFKPVEKTSVTFDDVAGMEEAKAEINELVIEPLKHPEVYKAFKKDAGGGIILYGAPGTGKTMIAQAIANEVDAAFFEIKCSDLVSKWRGDSEKNVKALFESARKYPCAIIFFDEFEALGEKRNSSENSDKKLVPELLAQMQGFKKSDNVLLLIAATNRPEDIDSAFMRSGRFSTHIYVELPNAEARGIIIKKQLKDVPVKEDLDYNAIIRYTENFNGADVVHFCDKLKGLAIKRTIEENKMSVINNQDIEEVAKFVKSTVQIEDLKRMEKFKHSTL